MGRQEPPLGQGGEPPPACHPAQQPSALCPAGATCTAHSTQHAPHSRRSKHRTPRPHAEGALRCAATHRLPRARQVVVQGAGKGADGGHVAVLAHSVAHLPSGDAMVARRWGWSSRAAAAACGLHAASQRLPRLHAHSPQPHAAALCTPPSAPYLVSNGPHGLKVVGAGHREPRLYDVHACRRSRRCTRQNLRQHSVPSGRPVQQPCRPTTHPAC